MDWNGKAEQMTRIGVVGAGRVGAVLATSLRAAGHEVVAVAGESTASRDRAAALLPGVPLGKPTVVARSCDLLLLTVPDDMLGNVVSTLVGAGAIRAGQYVVHTSGLHGLAVLEPAREVGAHVVAMHPAMTFTGTAVDLPRLAGCVFGVTVAGEAERASAESLVDDLGGVAMFVPEDKRTLYHAGLAHGANHLVTLVSQAMELLSASGAEDPAAVLRPLLGAALDNALDSGDARADRADRARRPADRRGAPARPRRPRPRHAPVVRRAGPGHGRPGGARRPAAGHPAPSAGRAARRARTGAGCPGRRAPRRGGPAPGGPGMSTRTPTVARTREELLGTLGRGPPSGSSTGAAPVALVPTMGALHAGHAALLRTARARVGADAPLVVSIFVNPLQFAPGEDLERYPRTLEADLALCAEQGADVVFAPSADEVYPGGAPQVVVDPGPLGGVLEGASRPSHFRGVLTVVAKLFGLVRPDVAVFGEKDYQQLALVRRMSADLCLGVDVVGATTVREPDGLALSSRNRFLDAEARRAAAALSRALFAGAEASRSAAEASGSGAEASGSVAEASLSAARAVLATEPEVAVDYLELTAPDLGPPPAYGGARLLVAARVGATR